MVALWLDQAEWVIMLVLAVCYSFTGVVLHRLPGWSRAQGFVRTYQGVVAPIFSIAGAAFALTIGFLGDAVWTTNRTASQIVMQEREGILTVIHLASDQTTDSRYLPDLARAYVRAVLDHEWNPPISQISAQATEVAIHDLMRSVAVPAVGMSLGAGLQTTLIHAVQRIADARTQRLGMLNLHTHHIRWACVLLLALLLQASIAAVHLDKPRPRALALVLATTSIVVIVGLVAISERPFSGAIMVSPLPLQQILQ